MVVEFWSLAPLLMAALPQTAFVLLYGVPWLGAGEWWSDRVGRALFLKAASLAVVLDLLLAHVLSLGIVGFSFAAPMGGFTIAETVGYWTVFGAVVYQLAALVIERAHERRAAL